MARRVAALLAAVALLAAAGVAAGAADPLQPESNKGLCAKRFAVEGQKAKIITHYYQLAGACWSVHYMRVREAPSCKGRPARCLLSLA